MLESANVANAASWKQDEVPMLDEDSVASWKQEASFEKLLLDFQASQRMEKEATGSGMDLHKDRYMPVLLSDWIASFQSEKDKFVSLATFVNVKLKELLELTGTGPKPNRVRTAACFDMLVAISNEVQGPLQHLLHRLTVEMISSVYAPPVGLQNEVPVLSDFLAQKEWFTMLEDKRVRNEVVIDRVQNLLKPSKLNSIRTLQKKVVQNIAGHWRRTIMTWCFLEWKFHAQREKFQKKRRSDQVLNVLERLTVAANRSFLKKFFMEWAAFAQKAKRRKNEKKLHETIKTKNGIADEKTALETKMRHVEMEAKRLATDLVHAKQALMEKQMSLSKKQQEVARLTAHKELCDKVVENLAPCLKKGLETISGQVTTLVQDPLRTYAKALPKRIRDTVRAWKRDKAANGQAWNVKETMANTDLDKFDPTEEGRITQDFLGYLQDQQQGLGVQDQQQSLGSFQDQQQGLVRLEQSVSVVLVWASDQMNLYEEALKETEAYTYGSLTGQYPEFGPFHSLAEFQQEKHRKRMTMAVKFAVEHNEEHESAYTILPSVSLFMRIRDSDSEGLILSALTNMMMDDAKIYDSFNLKAEFRVLQRPRDSHCIERLTMFCVNPPSSILPPVIAIPPPVVVGDKGIEQPEVRPTEIRDLTLGLEILEEVTTQLRNERTATQKLDTMLFFRNVGRLSSFIDSKHMKEQLMFSQLLQEAAQLFEIHETRLSDIVYEDAHDQDELRAIVQLFQQRDENIVRGFLKFANTDHMSSVQFRKFVAAQNLDLLPSQITDLWERVALGSDTIKFTRFREALLRIAITIAGPLDENRKSVSWRQQLKFILKHSVFTVKEGEQLSESNMMTYLQKLMSPAVKAVFELHKPVLKRVFASYTSYNDAYLNFNLFIRFLKDYKLLNTYLTTYDAKDLYRNLEYTNANGDIIKPNPDDLGSDPTDQTINQHRLNYNQFLECVTGVVHFTIRNPYLALQDRIDRFIDLHLKPVAKTLIPSV